MSYLLLTTAYFPPVCYFAAIAANRHTVIEQYENFGKQSYRNRCEILTANGVIPLTLPVAKANSKTLIRDLRIVYPTNWQKLHFKGIESAYKNSPYYDYYIDDIIPFFEKKETFLLDLNMAILYKMMECLGLNTSIITLTPDYIREGNPEYTDLRNAIHPKPTRRKANYEYTPSPYRQTFSDRFPFVPGLSILDLLFCCGPESIKKLKDGKIEIKPLQ